MKINNWKYKNKSSFKIWYLYYVYSINTINNTKTTLVRCQCRLKIQQNVDSQNCIAITYQFAGGYIPGQKYV